MNQFERLEQFAKLQKPPAIKFKDLEAAVNSTITFNILPMQVRADFFPVTELLHPDQRHRCNSRTRTCSSSPKEGVQKAIVNIYGRITSMSRRVVNVFEDAVTVDSAAGAAASRQQARSRFTRSRSRWRPACTG